MFYSLLQISEGFPGMMSIHGFGHKMIADLDKCHDMFSFRSGV